ncbi:phytanoyl-CoA dioxygenase domain-containing protein 1-like [Homarus americanus]|uniref:phytanoyl-CoA dioxygenase domain-containing protein 1-like n=1 Tax=Homarus americanus TaxID=6706 RepID=UPI001C49444C|nr:phytanoyl-CoA dioxygenase domain-containing protein 1-like [Homarus americanus]XP_042231055.1 phytanoyl-CoA dioxygenase domain-containing protein 1-like [Homarus americanus]
MENPLSPELLSQYRREGCVCVPGFLTDDEANSLRASCRRLVEEMDPTQHTPTIFSTSDHNQSRSSYFVDSGDKVHFFFEPEALDENSKLKVDKHRSLNKIGHALHWLVPEFKKVSFSTKMKAVARQLRFVSPAVVQSMYIFKQPGIGGEVVPHKDCTFLSTEPQSCVGFWFALEDVTLENGCLWYSPGSHNNPTSRRFIRNPDETGDLTCFTAPPDPDDPTKYIPIPVPKGTLVLINGQVDHKSKKNTSPNSRHIYTFHVIERHDTTWDPRNWLQPTPEMPFTGLYENEP